MHEGTRRKGTGNGDSSLLPFSISVTFYNNYSYIAKNECANAKHCVSRKPMIILILTTAIGRVSSFWRDRKTWRKRPIELLGSRDDDTAAARFNLDIQAAIRETIEQLDNDLNESGSKKEREHRILVSPWDFPTLLSSQTHSFCHATNIATRVFA